MRLRFEVPVEAPPERVFDELVATVLPQALEPPESDRIDRETTILTRWHIVLFRFIRATTTERVTLVPPDRAGFEHVEGPIRTSREVFRVVPRDGGRSAIRYRAVVRVPSGWFRVPGTWLIAGPLTFYASLRFARGIRDRAEGRG